jgi:hypothetical protein
MLQPSLEYVSNREIRRGALTHEWVCLIYLQNRFLTHHDGEKGDGPQDGILR